MNKSNHIEYCSEALRLQSKRLPTKTVVLSTEDLLAIEYAAIWARDYIYIMGFQGPSKRAREQQIDVLDDILARQGFEGCDEFERKTNFNKSEMKLADIQLKVDATRNEIAERIHCKVEELEIVEYPSGGIGIHWDAIYPRDWDINIPHGWIVAGVYPAENRLAMYADPGDFLCMA